MVCFFVLFSKITKSKNDYSEEYFKYLENEAKEKEEAEKLKETQKKQAK